ncbi:MAG: sporulation protein YtfJ [Oscillospiraceae bacterium]|nr:sporulation protein YtfJ [Oscillospiraceae bacterium]
MANTVVELMNAALTKIRDMVDVNTVVGDSITTPDGTTIIPVSSVGLGFGMGGTDWDGKSEKTSGNGGGGGGGVTVKPVSFLVVSPNGSVKVIPVDSSGGDSALEKIINAVPSVIDAVEGLIERFK